MLASAERGASRHRRRPRFLSRAVHRSVVLVCAATVGAPTVGLAQIRASERATITQVSDGTALTLNYSRPRVRGRTNIFGEVVHLGETWTPGANWATTLEVSRDVTLDGHPVKRGKYSMWFVVNEKAWTVILDPRFQLYHEERPDSTADQIRWTVQPKPAPFTEVLTWSFPEVRPDGTVLQFLWASTQVAINVTVKPSHPIAIARNEAEPFLGRYEWRWSDSGTEVAGVIELYYEEGEIRQRHTPFPEWYPRLQGQPMVRINDEWFIAAIRRDGKIWEMVADMIYEFDVVNGKAAGFSLRDDKDILLGSGKRLP